MKIPNLSKSFHLFLYIIVVIMAAEILFLVQQNRKLRGIVKDRLQTTRNIPGGLERGIIAPAIVSETVKGTMFNMKESAGSKILLIFFSTRCPACLEDIDNWQYLQLICQENDTKMVGIAFGKKQQVRKFAEVYDLSFDIIADSVGSISGLYKVGTIPQKLLINERSCIEHVSFGMSDESDISFMLQLVKGS